jgi:hypothetical protein
MPAFPSLDELLRLLRSGTERGSLRWKETADEDSFRATLGSGIVAVTKTGTAPFYKLEMLNPHGQLITEYEPSGEGELIAIKELYKTVRHKALNLDASMRVLVEELRSLAGQN